MGSVACNKKLVECYIDDHGIRVAVIAESNVTKSRINDKELSRFPFASYRRRNGGGVKEGGGRGVLIFVHGSVPYTSGRNLRVTPINEVEPRSAIAYPDYSYEQSQGAAGVYRSPGTEHPPYGGALTKILSQSEDEQITSTVAGDLNINSGGAAYKQ